MKTTVKKYVATFCDEVINENGENVVNSPEMLCDEDGMVLIGETYDEIYSLVMDDIDFWQMNRAVPKNHGFERKGDEIKVWDDFAIIRYTIKEIYIDINIEIK